MEPKGRLLIDFSALSMSAAFAQGIDNSLDEGFLRHLILNSILGARKKFKDYETVLCIDARTYWRKEVFPYYKAQRKAAREASTFDWTTFFAQRNLILNEIKNVFPYKIIEIDSAEADDIIGVLAAEATIPTVIYAEDNDFNQLAKNPNVRLYSPIKKKFKAEHTLWELDEHLFEKICRGDSGDGIPNIMMPGNAIVEKIRQSPISTKKINTWYESGIPENLKGRFEENKLLIDLKLIPEDLKQKIRDAIEEPVLGSKAKIFNYLTSKELLKISSRFLAEAEDF
jgi:5'-3' exonuclease